MTIYRPLLTTKPSELDAALSSEGIGATIQPVWELLPDGSAAPETELVQRLAHCARRVPWRIDGRHLRTAGHSPIAAIDAACRAGEVTFVPVIEATPDDDDLAAAADALAHHGRGLTVRVASPAGPADIERAAATVRALGLRPAHADLVVDCGFVPDALSASLTAGALLIPIYRAVTQGWRSVTVLAGSFPATPPEVPRAIPRHEVAMFRLLPFHVDFGDFGVAHPASPPADDTPTQLRWNRGDDWVQYTDVTRLPRAIRLAGDPAVASDPAKWAECSTARHLSVVRQRLDRRAA